jgi:hypothetical protein
LKSYQTVILDTDNFCMLNKEKNSSLMSRNVVCEKCEDIYRKTRSFIFENPLSTKKQYTQISPLFPYFIINNKGIREMVMLLRGLLKIRVRQYCNGYFSHNILNFSHSTCENLTLLTIYFNLRSRCIPKLAQRALTNS